MKTGKLEQLIVSKAGELLQRLSESDQASCAALLDQEGIPASTALQIIEKLVNMPKKSRAAIFQKVQSDDPFERRTALTMAAEVPPPPDPGLLHLREAHRELVRAAKSCRAAKFKGDLAIEVGHLKSLFDEFQEYNDQKRMESASRE